MSYIYLEAENIQVIFLKPKSGHMTLAQIPARATHFSHGKKPNPKDPVLEKQKNKMYIICPKKKEKECGKIHMMSSVIPLSSS